MLPWLVGAADPGRVHTEGYHARSAVEEARERVGELLGARAREVVFTSGATEAIHTALASAAAAGRTVAVVPTVEQSAVREAARRLGPGGRVAGVGVDHLGRFDAAEVLAAARSGGPAATVVVSVQVANQEVGTLQPTDEVVAGCREQGILVHVDATAAAGHLPVDFDALGADLLSVSAHRFGGPQGVGALLVRRGVRLWPLLVGGEQERGRRAGTENVAGIVGFGAATAVLGRNGGALLGEEAARARLLTDRIAAVALAVRGVVGYGDPLARVPHIVCFGVEGVEAEGVLVGLDRKGIAVHSGSACSSEALEPSPVLAAMGADADRSLRVSVGWSSTVDDTEAFAEAFPAVVAGLRALTPP